MNTNEGWLALRDSVVGMCERHDKRPVMGDVKACSPATGT